MVTAAQFRAAALRLDGTTEQPHFDRAAFKVRRIYATLAADGATANLRFSPDEQALKCLVAPQIFTAIDNGWGRQGWTTMRLQPAGDDDLQAALSLTHAHAVGKAPKTGL